MKKLNTWAKNIKRSFKNKWNKFVNTKLIRTLRDYWGIDDWIALFLVILGFAFFFVGIPENPTNILLKIYQNMHSEIIGIGVTVLILGNADEYIRNKVEKRRLILQMGSPDNGFAIEAVRQLREHNWLSDGSLRKISLIQADLQTADLFKAHLNEVNLAWANLNKVNLVSSNLKGAIFLGAHLENTSLHYSQMQNADFGGAFMKNANCYEANLEGANFRFAKMKKVFLVDSNLKKSNFQGANLEKARLSKATLEGASFVEANLEKTDFTKAHLQGANLQNANLRNALLSETHLEGADFRCAHLEGTHFTELQLPFSFGNPKHMGLDDPPFSETTYDTHTNWKEATYSKSTIWPKGFDPEAAGCILVDDPE